MNAIELGGPLSGECEEARLLIIEDLEVEDPVTKSVADTIIDTRVTSIEEEALRAPMADWVRSKLVVEGVAYADLPAS